MDQTEKVPGAGQSKAPTISESINKVWSMDFDHDALVDRRSLRLFDVLLDDFNCGGLAIEVDLSLLSARVTR